jgi:hypothetical protein
MNPENRPTSRDRSSMSLGVILALASLALPSTNMAKPAAAMDSGR